MYRLIETGLDPFRFLKPGRESFIDLLNRLGGTSFRYTDLELSAPVNTTSPYVAENEGLAKVAVTAITAIHLSGAIDVTYRRLDLGKFITPAGIPNYLVGDRAVTPADVSEYLKNHWAIQLDPTEFTISERLANPEDVTTWRIIVKPIAAHLVWTGTAEIWLASRNHLALVFPQAVLPGFDDPLPCVLETLADGCGETCACDCNCGCGGCLDDSAK